MNARPPSLRAIAAGGLVLLTVAACRHHETPVEDGIRTQTLLVGNLAEPKDLDPQVVTAYTDTNILVALFEGLTVLDERTSVPQPAAADHWEISPDGLTYTFHLRPAARWSNGDPLTAQDFAYSFRRILSPAFAAEYAYMLWPIRNAEAFNQGRLTDFSAVGVAAPDAATLQLTLERPTPYLLALAAHQTWFPVHRATLERFGRMDQPGTAWTRAGNLVGNGPFTLAEWRPNARITVAKNPLYWDAAAVRLNRIMYFPIESADVEEREFRAGQLHLTYDLPVAKIPAYRALAPSPYRNDPLLDTLYLNFNVTKPPFNDPRVRRALALAIDRDALSRRVFNGAWPAARALTPPDCGGYTSRSRVPEDLAEARRLLAAAGFPEGRGLPVFPVLVLNDLVQPKAAEAIQARWEQELGVHISIEPSEQKTWLQNQQSMTHTLAFLGWVADFADPVTFLGIFTTGNGNNWTGWGNPAYDHLIAQAAQTSDAPARFALFQQAEALLLNEAPVTPLVYRTRSYLIHAAVKNWEPAPIGLHQYKKVFLSP
jgi:oligopeptide transport system substrate-binding protein